MILDGDSESVEVTASHAPKRYHSLLVRSTRTMSMTRVQRGRKHTRGNVRPWRSDHDIDTDSNRLDAGRSSVDFPVLSK